MKRRSFDLVDGDGFDIFGGEFYLTCCDCDLVHNIKATKIAEGGIRLTFRRDNRKTAARRRGRRK